MDGNIGGAVGDERGNDPDKVDGKSVGLEFEEQARMPDPIIGPFKV